MNSSYRQWLLSGMVCAGAMIVAIKGSAAEPPAIKDKSKSDTAAGVSGREIFLREWLPNDPRSHGGDGLGPVFNDTSCVSCHNQGGVGGGGSEAKNVFVISAVRTNEEALLETSLTAPQAAAQLEAVPQSGVATELKSNLTSKEKERKVLLDELRSIHPGLVTARSVVLHKSGTDPKYAAWRDQALGVDPSIVMNGFTATEPARDSEPPQFTGRGFFADLAAQAKHSVVLELKPPKELLAEKGRSFFSRFPDSFPMGFGDVGGPEQQRRNLAAVQTQRNSIALFGAGLIDSIPNAVIESVAAKKYEEFPEISGRIARLKDGQIGRFGWKAQKANLYDFTMTACAVEIGLHVPDHPQAGVPHRPEYQPTGFDLNRDECRELVQFLKDLPAPTRAENSNPAIAKEFQLGEVTFAKIGCAACHVADMGEVRGIFSDLLVHDLGSELGDSGSYGVFQPQSPGNDADDPLSGLLTRNFPLPILGVQVIPDGQLATPIEESIPDKMIGAGRQEWRTPPLWGVRDSAPYMHDGRAGSLEQAIASHGGEAQLSANRFFRLDPDDRARVLSFLRSLVAPQQVASAGR